MQRELPLVPIAAGIAALLAVLFAIGWATRDDPAARPLLEISGGGFVFNYRMADVFYGFTAVVQRPLESGAIIEATFENPAGGAPLVVRQRVSPRTTQYALRSPSVRGVEADRAYRVAIRVLDRRGAMVLFSRELSLSSQISDAAVPDAPLTVGPGYARPIGNQSP